MARKKRKIRLLLYIPFWILIVVMFTSVVIMQASRYDAYRREFNKVSDELAQAVQAEADLMEQMHYYGSDAYIEQQARDQLGFVRPDEIVFVNTAP